MLARARSYEHIRAYNAAIKPDIKLFPTINPKTPASNKLTPAKMARMLVFHQLQAFLAKASEPTDDLCPEIVIAPNTCVDTLPLPKSYHDAVTGPYHKYWIKAITAELQNLINYRVWREEEMPPGTIPVRGKFVFKWKPDEHNHLDRAKARFCMQGFRQIKGIHFDKQNIRPRSFCHLSASSAQTRCGP